MLREPAHSAVGRAIFRLRRHLVVVALVSAAANLLVLTGPIFMLQIYDRVLSSGSVPTLVVLAGIVTVLFAFLGAFDWVRLLIMGRVGVLVDAELGPQAFSASLVSPAAPGEPTRDVANMRQFMSSPGPMFFFDLPWLPVFLVIVFLFHPILGLVATLGGAVLIALSYLNQRSLHPQVAAAAEKWLLRNRIAGSAQRNAETVAALGMAPAFSARFLAVDDELIRAQLGAGDSSAAFTSAIKALRMLLQSALLATGAALAIAAEVTPGVMIAASIIAARALAPVEQAIGSWRSFLQFRQAWQNLDKAIAGIPVSERKVQLPKPAASFQVSKLAFEVPGREHPLLHDINFQLRSGETLGVVGPSGAGKTTLARLIVGVATASAGEIRLDGATREQWMASELARHVGYLPQTVDLFDGTVAENIARFLPHPDAQQIIAAARDARAHSMILALPDGYETPVGEAGRLLSAGQRQRVGLARALFGEPFLVVLDEPHANVDAEGREGLLQAVDTMRGRGSIVVVMAHAPLVIQATSNTLVLVNGRQRAFGPTQEILSTLMAPPVPGGQRAA